MNWQILSRKMAAAGFPALGGALGGPAGAAVGATLAARLGVEAQPDAVAKAYINDPNVTIALRRLEAEMAEDERQHVERMTDSEMAHAERLTESETANLNAGAAFAEANIREARLSPDLNRMRAILLLIMLAVLVLALVGLTVVWIWNNDFPEALFALIGTVIGMFVAKVGGGWDYFFGTSSGSAAKERTASAERMIAAERGR